MSPDVHPDKAGTAGLAFPCAFQGRGTAFPHLKDPRSYSCYSQRILSVPDPTVQSGSLLFHRNNGVKTSTPCLCTPNGYRVPPCHPMMTGELDGSHLVSWAPRLRGITKRTTYRPSVFFFQWDCALLSTPGLKRSSGDGDRPRLSTLTHPPGSRTYPVAIRESRFPGARTQPYSQVEQKEAVGGQGLPSLCVCADRVTTRLEKRFPSGEFLNLFQKTNKQQQNNPTGFSF